MSEKTAAHPINVQVRDLSPTGIGLLLPRQMKAGDHLLVRLASREYLFWVLCEVKRVEHVAEGLYITGATYTRIITPQAAPERLTMVGRSV